MVKVVSAPGRPMLRADVAAVGFDEGLGMADRRLDAALPQHLSARSWHDARLNDRA